jgi:hypothetical protein
MNGENNDWRINQGSRGLPRLQFCIKRTYLSTYFKVNYCCVEVQTQTDFAKFRVYLNTGVPSFDKLNVNGAISMLSGLWPGIFSCRRIFLYRYGSNTGVSQDYNVHGTASKFDGCISIQYIYSSNIYLATRWYRDSLQENSMHPVLSKHRSSSGPCVIPYVRRSQSVVFEH